MGLFPGDLHDHRGEGRSEGHAETPRSASATTRRLDFRLAHGGAVGNDQAAQGRRPAEVIRRGRRRSARPASSTSRSPSSTRRSAARAQLPRLLLQHRLRNIAEEGLRRRRDGVQEGDRAEARSRARRGRASPTSTTPRTRPTLRSRRAPRPPRSGGGGTAAAARRRWRTRAPARSTTRASSSGTPASSPRPRRSSRRRPRPIRTFGRAWYRLGMANVNLGDMPGAVSAFEAYLKAAPTGAPRRRGQGVHRGDEEVGPEVAAIGAWRLG